MIAYKKIGLMLLLVCANVANLLLARATNRSHEITVRITMGGRRSRIIRQLLTESLLLAILGGVIGIALVFLGIKAIVAIIPDETIPPHMLIALTSSRH